jgi:hypothetical protein
MSKKVPANICPETSACWDMGDVRDLYSRGSIWFPCISTLLSALRRTEVRTLSKGFTRISWQELSIRYCNYTSKSLIGAEYTKVFRFPQPKIQKIKVRRSCRPVDWASASYPLFTESLVRVPSDNAEKMRWWPTMHEPHVLSLMKRHMFCEYWQTIHKKTHGTLHLLVCSVRQVVIKSWSPKMPAQTMTRPYLSIQLFLDIWWLGPFFSSEWVLYPFKAWHFLTTCTILC